MVLLKIMNKMPGNLRVASKMYMNITPEGVVYHVALVVKIVVRAVFDGINKIKIQGFEGSRVRGFDR
jgi:hypothetical protein